MQVLNVHTRRLACPAEKIGELLDSLGSRRDRLWPPRWPPMRLHPGLTAGARGGQGPIRYRVDRYEPGRRARFIFEGPPGFRGYHEMIVEATNPEETTLRHVLEMDARGSAQLSWPLVFRPLHDALIEDAFGAAEEALGLPRHPRPWSWWVRFLRWILGSRRSPRRGQARAA